MAVTLILLLVFMSGRFIKYLGQAASGGLSPDVLFAIMWFRLPGFLELILPLGFFIGLLLAYGRMYLESEMTVLHACGLSHNRLLVMSLFMSAIVALIVGALSTYFSPAGMQRVEQIFQEQSKVTEFEMLFPGKFQKLKSGQRVTYTESLSEDKKILYDVFISEPSSNGEGMTLMYAETGKQDVNEDTGERFLVLSNGARYEGVPGKGSYRLVEFESYGIRIEEPDAESRSVKDEALATQVLFQSDRQDYKALLHWRLSLPMLVPVITLLAMSLCRVNPRQGRFFHLFPAMLIYVAYLGMLIVVRNKLAKGDIDSVLGLWLVHGLFFAVSAVLYTRDVWRAWLSGSRAHRQVSHAQN